MFNFDTPFFQLKFIQGKLLYELGIQKNKDFLNVYREENRSVVEQKLNLTEEQKQKMVQKLKFLYLPENRYYLYGFLYKNCATEVRDLLFEMVPQDTTFLEKAIGKTYRMLIDECLSGKYWTQFGINLILGSPVDKEATIFYSMFLPSYLQQGLDGMQNNREKLVTGKKLIVKQEKEGNWDLFFLSPFVIFILFFLLLVMFKSSKLGVLFWLVWGMLGVLLVFVSFSDHQELHWNFNLLWCNPFYILFTVFQVGKKEKLKEYLAYFLLICLVFACGVWLLGIQTCDGAYIPVILTVIVLLLRTIFPNLIKTKKKPVFN